MPLEEPLLGPSGRDAAAEPQHRGSSSLWHHAQYWMPRLPRRSTTPPPATSNYLTLIPLSDERLKPRHDKLLIGIAVVFAAALAAGVFLVVPRGVNVGAVQVRSHEMSFNTTSGAYRIIVRADLPIYNPNPLPIKLSGVLNVTYYDQQAGWAQVQATSIKGRSNPEVVQVYIDASNVPRSYMDPLHEQCWSFPQKLVFFLRGVLQADYYLAGAYQVPAIDTYFLLDCAQGVRPPPPPPAAPAAPPAARQLRRGMERADKAAAAAAA